MKDEYVKKNITSVIGTLDYDEGKNFFIRIENKDSVEEVMVADVLNDLIGSQIKIYSEENRV